MRKQIKGLAIASTAVALALLTTNANAYTITPTVSMTTGNPVDTAGITGFATLGNQMVGITVTAFFTAGSGGGSDSQLWVATGSNGGSPAIGNSGGAFGTAGNGSWSLTVDGNTIGAGLCGGSSCGGVWVLTNPTASTKTIDHITINLVTANPTDFAFDVSPQGGSDGGDNNAGHDVGNSPNSFDGNAFGNRGAVGSTTYFDEPPGYAPKPYIADVPTGAAGLTASAAYTNALRVGGLFFNDPSMPGCPGAGCPITDEYEFLTIQFGGTFVAPNTVFRFQADTDTLTTNAQVPEPMTLVIFGFGLVGLGALRRRRKAA